MSVALIIYTHGKAADPALILTYLALIPEFHGKEAVVHYSFSVRVLDDSETFWRTLIRVDDEAGVMTSKDVFLITVCGQADEFTHRRLDKFFRDDYATNVVTNVQPQEVTSWSINVQDPEWGLVKCARLKGGHPEVVYQSIVLDNRSLITPL